MRTAPTTKKIQLISTPFPGGGAATPAAPVSPSKRRNANVSTSLTSTPSSSTTGWAHVGLSATRQVRCGANASVPSGTTISSDPVVSRNSLPPPARIAALSPCRPSESQSVCPVAASRAKNCPRLRWENP